MSNLGLRLPVDIPWKRIGVSYHMMDRVVCEGSRPRPMRPSVAIFEYEPDDAPGEEDSAYRVSYLKVTCSVTSWGASNLDRLRKSRRRVTSPLTDWWEGGSSSEETDPITFDSSVSETGADFPCFGALLEVSVGPRGEGKWELDQYPYFSDFDPKKRELYELVSETNEILSRSLEETGVLHGGTTSSSSEVFDKDTIGVSLKETKESPTYGPSKSEAGASFANESGSRSVNSAEFKNVRSVDAGRENRETYSHTTQLTQMYQLLSSYHLGTNRAVFYFEPRPHIAQNPRTIIEGPRQLEGIQEFFLVVARPREMESICVNASLETLHVGKTVNKPTEQPSEKETVTLHLPATGYNGSYPEIDNDWPSHGKSDVFIPPPGKMIDMAVTEEIGVDGEQHAGYLVTQRDVIKDGGATVDATVTVTSKYAVIDAHVIEPFRNGDIVSKDIRSHGRIEMKISMNLIPEVDPRPAATEFAVLVDTSVCSCKPRPLMGVENVGKEIAGVVRELKLPQRENALGRPMTVDAAGRWNRFFNRVIRSSASAPDRYPRGAVDFWDLDIMKEPLSDLAKRGPWERGATVGRVIAGADTVHLAEEARAYLSSPRVAETPVVNILSLGLRDFVDTSGLAFGHAAVVRRALWDRLTAEGSDPGAAQPESRS